MALVEPDHFAEKKTNKITDQPLRRNREGKDFFVGRGEWSFGNSREPQRYASLQLEKVAAQARRPILLEKDIVEGLDATKSKLRTNMEALKAASFVISSLAFGGMMLALLLIGSSYSAGNVSSFPRNIVILVLSLLFLVASRRLRSRVSVYLRSQNI